MKKKRNANICALVCFDVRRTSTRRIAGHRTMLIKYAINTTVGRHLRYLLAWNRAFLLTIDQILQIEKIKIPTSAMYGRRSKGFNFVITFKGPSSKNIQISLKAIQVIVNITKEKLTQVRSYLAVFSLICLFSQFSLVFKI